MAACSQRPRATGSSAGPYEDALAELLYRYLPATPTTAVTAIAASGNPLAAAGYPRRCSDGRAFFRSGDKTVYYQGSAGRQAVRRRDRTSRSPCTPPISRTVRLNNRLRRTVDAAHRRADVAVGRIQHARYEAAQAVFKSRDASRAAGARQALAAKKPTPREARAGRGARRDASSTRPTLQETDKLQRRRGGRRKRGDQDALRLAAPACPADSPRGSEGSGRRRAIATVEQSLALWSTVQNAWYGLSLGSVLLLAAIGLAITFGVMGVINMAHGEMVMLGAYVTFVVQEIIRTTHPGPVRLSRWSSPCRSPFSSRASSASSSSAASSASSMAVRWRRCSRPGAYR